MSPKRRRKQRFPNTDPLRRVVNGGQPDAIRTGRAGLLMGKSAPLTIRWWALELECGHVVERPVRYQKQDPATARRGWSILYRPQPVERALPAPKKVRCERCGYIQKQERR